MDFIKKLKDIFSNSNITVIEYTKPKEKIIYKCNECGSIYEYKNAISLFSKLSLCKKCNSNSKRWNLNKLTERLKKIYPESEIEIIDFKSYKNPIILECKKCNSIYRYSNLGVLLRNLHGDFCEKCDYKKNKIYKKVINELPEYIELLEWNGASKMNKFYCKKCLKDFNRIVKNSSSMNYCPYHTKSNNSLTIEEADEELKQKMGKTYSLITYNGKKKKSKILHDCGTSFEKRLDDFYQSKGCPKCYSNCSKLELKVKKALDELNIKYIQEKRFNDFNKYPYDFYVLLKNKEFVIEAQGRQHYMPVPVFDDFKKQKERDAKKKDYCAKKDIILIEIPYYEKNIKKVLTEKFNDYLETE